MTTQELPVRVECGRPSPRFWSVGVPTGGDAYSGRKFGYEAVAPAVLGIKECLHSGGELSLAVTVHDARDGVEFRRRRPGPSTSAAATGCCALQLALARQLGNKVEVPAVLGEPLRISTSRGTDL